ncbi:ABC transporter ATP-binding protein [Nocardioides pocheonensis]|uniref:ABC transporter ATP-binding protein n=1 Tax=Nocardioides pocheonensis TaxID=661485 RepID=A0A3N0GW01_9ACTN|nr:ABC transporter ATP-binding protein [Nocardioides pocheonensis]RNM16356.1 ABC transporter ATP-binding protein [Nocardioides pocheonensis]
MRESGQTPSIRLVDLAKDFGSVRAVAGVDLEIADGEFFSMLGPSGSGKTTVLRMIAGFEPPTRGRIELAGADVTDDPPFARDVNTVFQDYALFPHMSVLENVEYGLRVKKVARAERRRRAVEALETVRLGEHVARRPSQLSGGQRQRVALARALVNRPKVLLLDEPLGALDLKLRREMQIELKQIQREVGITFVFVTHDQEEALTLSDRIAVFNDGRVQQVATPRELYEQPGSAFVAGFVGTSNLLDGPAARAVIGRDGVFSIRPEKIHLDPAADLGGLAGAHTVEGVVREVVYLGSANHYVVELDVPGGSAGASTTLTVLRQNLDTAAEDPAERRGDRVRLAWLPEHVIELGTAAPVSTPTTQESA